MRVVTWVVFESVQCVIADAVAHFGLYAKSDEATPILPPGSPSVVVDVLGEDLYSNSDWDLSDISLSGVIEICSSLGGDSSLIQEKHD